MTKYKQLVTPNLYIEDHDGYSLRHIQTAFKAPVKNFTAWEAWQATKYRHLEAPLPDAYVPVWFWSHIPGYGINPLGHVMIWDPLSQKLFGTPQGGYGRRWYDMDQIVGPNTRYVGWSEDFNGMRIVKQLKNV